MIASLNALPGVMAELATTNADGPNGQIDEHSLQFPFPVHLFPRDQGETYKYSAGMETWLKQHAREYDVIQAHGHWCHSTKVACRAGAAAKVPVILRPCGMMSSYSWQKSWLKKRVYWWLAERRNVFSAAGFHTTSTGEQEEIRALGVTVPVANIPLGLSDDAFQTPIQKTWLRQRLPQAGSLPIVLYLSRLHPKKGITDLLLPAMKTIAEPFFLAIVGEEDTQTPGYEAEIRQTIKELQLESRVALLGPFQGADKWAAMDGADVFVLPSRSENFGIVVAEAMARGLPQCVTTGVQGAEHVSVAGAGVVVPVSVEGIQNGLGELLRRPETHATMALSAKLYAESVFSWARVAEELRTLYENVIAGGVAARPRATDGRHSATAGTP
jgi:glycosyltransferase involved in cell wall biosynthesis